MESRYVPLASFTQPIFNVKIGTVNFIVKKWSVALKWMWKGKYYGKSIGTVHIRSSS